MEEQAAGEARKIFEEGRLLKPKVHKILIKQEDGEVVATVLIDPRGDCKLVGKTPSIVKEMEEKIGEISARPLVFTTGYAEKYGGPVPYEEVAREFKKDDPFYSLVLVNALNEHLWERAARLAGRQLWAVLVS